MKTDVWHWISPYRLWDVKGEPEEARDQHEDALFHDPNMRGITIRYINTNIYFFHQSKPFYLNPSSHYDSHEEIRQRTRNHHHQAFDHCNARIEAKDEEQVVHKAMVKAHHEVAYGARERERLWTSEMATLTACCWWWMLRCHSARWASLYGKPTWRRKLNMIHFEL